MDNGRDRFETDINQKTGRKLSVHFELYEGAWTVSYTHLDVYKRQSISHAVGVLKNGGFLTVDEDGYLNLTNAGREVAEKIYERHQFFTEQLVAVGVDRETAERDACRIEHVISEEAFEKLKTSVEKKY